MATAVCNQVAFRGRDDTQTLNSSTFTYSQNANWTQAVDTTFRVRFEMEEINSKTFTVTGQLQYSLNSGAWTSVTSSSAVVKGVTSSQFTDGDVTTNVLTVSAKTFVAGQGICDGVANNVSLSNTQTEHEYCIQIVGTDVAHNDTIQLRVAALTGYTVTPTVTVSKVGTPTINKSEGLSVSESRSVVLPDALAKSVTDTAGVVDTSPVVQLQQATPRDISKSDTIAVSEAINASLEDLIVQAADNTSVADAPQVEFEALPPFIINVSTEPSVSVSDNAELIISDLIINVADTIDASDIALSSMPDALLLSGTDTVLAEDAYTGFIEDLETTAEDTINVSDAAPEFFFPSGEDFEISKTDDVGVVEAVSAEMPDNLIVSGSDTADLGEIVDSKLEDLENDISDAISIADTATVERKEEIIFTIDVVETIKAKDTVPGSYVDSIALDETFTVSLQAIFTPVVNVSDTIDVSEITDTVLEDLSLPASDTVSVSELSFVEEEDLIVTWSENIALGEASTVIAETVAGLTINVSDNITLDEAVFAAIQDNLLISKTDSVLVGENVYIVREVEGEYSLIVSDSIGVGEAVTVSIPDNLVINRYDNVTISDIATLQEGMYVTISENFQVYDTPSASVSTSIISITDGLSIGDSRTVSLGSLTIDKTDTLDILDTPEGWIGISLSVSEGISLEDIASVLMLDALAISVYESLLVRALNEQWVYGVGVGEPDIFLYDMFVNTVFDYTANVETYEVVLTIQDVYINTEFSYEGNVNTAKDYEPELAKERRVEITV